MPRARARARGRPADRTGPDHHQLRSRRALGRGPGRPPTAVPAVSTIDRCRPVANASIAPIAHSAIGSSKTPRAFVTTTSLDQLGEQQRVDPGRSPSGSSGAAGRVPGQRLEPGRAARQTNRPSAPASARPSARRRSRSASCSTASAAGRCRAAARRRWRRARPRRPAVRRHSGFRTDSRRARRGSSRRRSSPRRQHRNTALALALGREVHEAGLGIAQQDARRPASSSSLSRSACWARNQSLPATPPPSAATASVIRSLASISAGPRSPDGGEALPELGSSALASSTVKRAPSRRLQQRRRVAQVGDAGAVVRRDGAPAGRSARGHAEGRARDRRRTPGCRRRTRPRRRPRRGARGRAR